MVVVVCVFFFFSSRRRHTRFDCDWSSDVCSSDLRDGAHRMAREVEGAREADERRPHIGCPVPERGLLLAEQETTLGDGTSDRKSTRLNSSHSQISYAVFCLKKKKMSIDLGHM